MTSKTKKTYSPRLADRLLGWSDNEIYGHGSIIRAYTGIHRRVAGHIQHGWNPYSGWTLAGKELLRPTSRRYVWGKRQLDYSARNGLPVRATIGAPWLYGPLRSYAGATPPKDNSYTLLIPLHGTTDHPVSYSHERLADKVAREASQALTVCLHPNEARNPSLVQIYLDRGFEVVTAGDPFSPKFLYNQAKFIFNSSQVVTNRVSTALFYAGSLKRKVTVTEDPATIAGEGNREPHEIISLRKTVGAIGHDVQSLYEFSMTELGFEFMQDPSELARILGLVGPERAQYPLHLARSHAGRMMRRLR